MLNSSVTPNTCDPCSVQNCLNCSTDSSLCEMGGCRVNFVLESNSCNCQTTNGFRLAGPSVCEQCLVENCISCSGGAATCDLGGCRQNFQLDSNFCRCAIESGFFLDEATTPHTCGICDSNCKTCQDSAENSCLSCYDGKSIAKGGTIGRCEESLPVLACQCRQSDDSCRICPKPYEFDSNPDSFYLNAALTFFIEEQVTKQKASVRKYRIKFSDPPIILESPFSFENIETWLKLDLEGYKSGNDFTYTLTSNPMGYIDLKI